MHAFINMQGSQWMCAAHKCKLTYACVHVSA